MNNTPSNIHITNVPLKLTTERKREGGYTKKDERMRNKKHMAHSPFLSSTFFPLSFHYSLSHKYRLHIKASPVVSCLIIQWAIRQRKRATEKECESLLLNSCIIVQLWANLILISFLFPLIPFLNITPIVHSILLSLWSVYLLIIQFFTTTFSLYFHYSCFSFWAFILIDNLEAIICIC